MEQEMQIDNRPILLILGIVAFLMSAAEVRGQQAPYLFRDVLPRTKPSAEQRPGQLPEQLQTQGPGRLESLKWQIGNAEVATLDRTRIDLLEKKIELLEKRLLDLEGRKK